MTKQTNGSPTALLVDDTETKRYVLSSWLRRAGYVVIEAATGAEALRQVSTCDVDVAVLDVHLPDMSGFEVCRTIKGRAASAGLPVLHVSAVAVDVADRAAGLDFGADAYLVDPIEPQEFLSTVRALTRQGEARRKAEQMAHRLEQLSIATLRINVALNAARLASAAAEGASGIFSGPATTVLRDEHDQLVSSVAGWPGPDRTLDEGTATALMDAVAAEDPAAATPDAPRWTSLLPELPGGQVWLAETVRERADAVTGVIAHAVNADDDHDDHRVLVRQLAKSVAVAQENLRVFAAEHHIALTLQRSLLPATLPTLPGMAVAARYRASAEQAEIGGDFFDAFETQDGCAVLVIGDVQGHSLSAAVVMAELRYSLRAYALDGYSPAAVLDRVNRLLLRGHPETTATVCTVTFSPDRARAEIVNAGHIPPLLVHAGDGDYLDAPGLMLGVLDPLDADSVTVRLSPGSRLLLMTDGLVERRRSSLDTNLDRVASAVVAHAGDVERLSDDLMSYHSDSDDDVALVVAEVEPDRG